MFLVQRECDAPAAMRGKLTSNRFSVSENGWTSQDHCFAWYKEWEKETREKANGQKRVLIMDGHNSHYSLPLIRQSREDNVVILGYPPHCTHALQGLDVICFGPFKKTFHFEVREFEKLHNHGLKKDDFAGVFGKAFLRTFHRDLIKKAFEVTGVVPFNPNVIRPELIAPSAATSLTSSFPQLHTSPVRAVIAVFEHNRPTAFDCSEDTVEPEIDPSLYTPTKRRRQLVSAIAGTQTGSYLVDRAKPITAATPLPQPVIENPPEVPEPNWSLQHQERGELEGLTNSQLISRVLDLAENLGYSYGMVLARDAVVRGTQAQIIIQDLHLRKMKNSLFAKEEGDKGTETMRIAPDAHGQVLNDTEFEEKVARMNERKEQKEASKVARKAAQKKKKDEKEELETRWQEATTKWRLDKEVWEQTVAALVRRVSARRTSLHHQHVR
jgi:hypothetical protein